MAQGSSAHLVASKANFEIPPYKSLTYLLTRLDKTMFRKLFIAQKKQLMDTSLIFPLYNYYIKKYPITTLSGKDDIFFHKMYFVAAVEDISNELKGCLEIREAM